MQGPKISIIIPTYNERENLEAVFSRIREAMKGYDYEVIIVDDFSPDGTWALAKEYERTYPNVKAIIRDRRRGLGSAIKRGFEESKGDLIATMDADLSHDPSLIPRFIDAMERMGAAVVVGSRFIRGGRIEGRNWIRNAISWLASRVSLRILGLQTHDVTSGFRLYRRDVLQKVLPRTRCIKFDFQLEVLSRIHEKIVEIPIIFRGKEKARREKAVQRASILSRIREKIVEVPIVFRERRRGRSKFTPNEIASFLTTVWSLFLERQGPRFMRFCALSLSGIAVAELLFWLLTGVGEAWLVRSLRAPWLLTRIGPIWAQHGTPARIIDLLAVLVVMEALILHHLFGNEFWVFRDVAGPGRIWRAIRFNAVCLIGACVCLLLFIICSVLYGLNPYVGLLPGIICESVWNFVMSLNWAYLSTYFERPSPMKGMI